MEVDILVGLDTQSLWIPYGMGVLPCFSIRIFIPVKCAYVCMCVCVSVYRGACVLGSLFEKSKNRANTHFLRLLRQLKCGIFMSITALVTTFPVTYLVLP